jgi:Chaperone of endosialidase
LGFNLATVASGVQNSVAHQALHDTTTGHNNTAIGSEALFNNTIGFSNTVNGSAALFNNTTGDGNTGIGAGTLLSNTNGDNNTAIGLSALAANSTGSSNIGIGLNSGGAVTTADHVICIGGVAGANVSNTCFIDNIRGAQTQNANAIPVLIDSAGQLGTASSSRRFKKEIKPMDKTSEAILALKPVTFYYKRDGTNTPQFGLVAEDVAQLNPDLVVRDENGNVYTVRYDAINAMLLNEFLKEHRKVQELEATVAEHKKAMQVVMRRLEEQAADI